MSGRQASKLLPSSNGAPTSCQGGRSSCRLASSLCVADTGSQQQGYCQPADELWADLGHVRQADVKVHGVGRHWDLALEHLLLLTLQLDGGPGGGSLQGAQGQLGQGARDMDVAASEPLFGKRLMGPKAPAQQWGHPAGRTGLSRAGQQRHVCALPDIVAAGEGGVLQGIRHLPSWRRVCCTEMPAAPWPGGAACRAYGA